jgi:hypothetical protein
LSDEWQEPTPDELERERRAVRQAGSRLADERQFRPVDAGRVLLRFVGVWLLLIVVSLVIWQILRR